jgi:hypothetical protein
MTESARLHALVVTYRRDQQLALTLTALARQSRPPDTVTVVDNDPEQSAKPVVDAVAIAQYVATGSNLGPAGGLAAGFDVIDTMAKPDDFVVFVDDDDPPWSETILEELLAFRAACPGSPSRVGAVGAAGAIFNRRTGLLRRLNDSELVGAIRVQYLGGNQFPIYSVGALRESGCSRPDLFFGFDDLELGLRLEEHGYALFGAAELWAPRRAELGRNKMSARDAAGIRTQNSWRRYYSVRNLIWIARVHGGPVAPLVTTVRSGLGPALADITRKRSLAAGRPALRGVRDAWLNRLGQRVTPD